MWSQILVGICLLLFFAVNLDNILRYHTLNPARLRERKNQFPRGFPLAITTLGTVLFFLDSVLYVIIGFVGFQFPQIALFDFAFMDIQGLEFAGALVMTIGYVTFIWSVIARGKYATSWIMPPGHRLVDWGPYRYVRHPSYLGYFLMFLGFFLLWPNILALVPIVAIPGYVLVTTQEEEMLKKRFGNAYVEYAQRVGRFLPRVRELAQ